MMIMFVTWLHSLQIGEKLIFKVSYGLIPAGKASLTFTDTMYKDSIPAYRIVSKAKTNGFFDNIFKVRDHIESVWDKDSLVTLKFYKKLREGSYRQKRIHFYYPDQNFTLYWKYNRKTKDIKEEKMEIPDKTQDILTAFYWLRKQKLEVGKTFIINVTADGRNYPAKVKVHRKEKLDTEIGRKECFVVEPLLEGEAIFKQTGKILVWLTDDEEKIPVRLQSKIVFGHFKAILQKVKYIN